MINILPIRDQQITIIWTSIFGSTLSFHFSETYFLFFTLNFYFISLHFSLSLCQKYLVFKYVYMFSILPINDQQNTMHMDYYLDQLHFISLKQLFQFHCHFSLSLSPCQSYQLFEYIFMINLLPIKDQQIDMDIGKFVLINSFHFIKTNI